MADKQRIYPMLVYDDAPTALNFLRDAFGFEEKMRMPMADGRIGHAEIALGGAVVMLASCWRPAGMKSPQDLAGVHSQIACVVDDVDAHYRRALERGATIIGEPADQPYGRTYRALDTEGHRWIFMQEPNGH
jgi:uncharacterized glyoxalase superfamily protein PhnB